MKKIILSCGIAVSIAIILFACDKSLISQKANTSKTSESQLKSIINDITIVCTGNCSGSSGKCSLMGTLPKNVSCSCSGCTMKVTKTQNGITTITNLSDTDYPVNYLNLFEDYMVANYPDQSYVITKYNLQESEDEFVETYAFELEEGVTETVVLIGDAQGISDKVKVYDCTGSCGCREIYTFSTGTVSCSCSDCSLKVTVVKK